MRFQTKPSRKVTRTISNWAQPSLNKQIGALLLQVMKQEFNFDFVRLHSKPGAPAQAVHCDHEAEGLVCVHGSLIVYIFFCMQRFLWRQENLLQCQLHHLNFLKGRYFFGHSSTQNR